jgi:hypothetical protein
MLRNVSRLVAVAVALAVGLAAQSAWAQGCCKAGVCSIPRIPTASSGAETLARMPVDRSLAATSVSARATTASPSGEGGFVLVNPVGSRAAVQYTLGSKTYQLEPGMSLSVASAAPMKIEFARSESGPRAQYRVSRGTYEFAMTNTGWELYRE